MASPAQQVHWHQLRLELTNQKRTDHNELPTSWYYLLKSNTLLSINLDSSFKELLVLNVLRKAPEDTGNMPLNMLIVVVFPGASHKGVQGEAMSKSLCVIQSFSD